MYRQEGFKRVSEEKKPVKINMDNTNRSPDKLNEYIRIGSLGGFLLIAGLVLLAVAMIIWGFTGRIPVTTTQTGIVVESKEESHGCLCFVDVNDNIGVIPAGTPASVKMADGSVCKGSVDFMSENPLSAEELRDLYGAEHNAKFQFSDWMFSKLLKDDSYYYMIRINTEEDVAEYWHQLTAVTVVMREVRPISYLMR